MIVELLERDYNNHLNNKNYQHVIVQNKKRIIQLQSKIKRQETRYVSETFNNIIEEYIITNIL